MSLVNSPQLYLDQLSRGERIKLSPFWLSRRSLILDRDEIAWSNVAEITVSDNKVRVVPRRGAVWAQVPLRSMPLAAVFVPLATMLTKQHAAPGARRSGERAPGTPPDLRQSGENNPFDFG